MIIKIGKKHINSEANPLRAALVEAGFSEIHFEIYLNLLPPRHDWKIHVDGTRFEMTWGCRDYYDRWRIGGGSQTRPAHLILDRREGTADIRVIRIPKGAPPWVHADMTLTEWRAMLKESQLPHPKGLGLLPVPRGLLGSALLSLSGVSGSFTTDAPPRKATAAF